MSIVLVGCGPGAPVITPAAGVVTFDGKRLPGPAVIHFISSKGFGSSTAVDSDGRFVLGSEWGRGIPPGVYQVRVSPEPISISSSSPAQRRKMTPNIDPPYIPNRYRDYATSGLAFEVTEDGTGSYDIIMVP